MAWFILQPSGASIADGGLGPIDKLRPDGLVVLREDVSFPGSLFDAKAGAFLLTESDWIDVEPVLGSAFETRKASVKRHGSEPVAAVLATIRVRDVLKSCCNFEQSRFRAIDSYELHDARKEGKALPPGREVDVGSRAELEDLLAGEDFWFDELVPDPFVSSAALPDIFHLIDETVLVKAEALERLDAVLGDAISALPSLFEVDN